MERADLSTPRVAVAMSGGVDSSVCALLLRDAGYLPMGVTFRMFPETTADDAARRVCEAMSIPFASLDVSAEFAATVTADFQREYLAGRTPNPCVLCNREIKFPFLMRYAEEADCCKAATGHYVRLAKCGSRFTISRAKDENKDQSYMLWRLPQEVLARMIFPLGEYTKPQIREIAAAHELPSAHTGDSQDVCFIPDGDYAAYLSRCGIPLPPGVFSDETGRVLGASKNQACYTVGQRRGLGIALGQHMYVTERIPAENRVVISPRDPYAKTVYASSVNFLAAAPGDLDTPRRLSVKLRYTRHENRCLAVMENGRLSVTLEEAARAPSPGQSLVLYDGNDVVAGGLIDEWTR